MVGNGDEHEFVGRIETHRGLLAKVAAAYCRDAAQREDLIQDMVLQLWSSRTRFDDRLKFSTWMYRVALNVAISAYRRQMRRPETIALSESFAESLPSLPGEDDALPEVLREHVERLDEFNRALVVLYLDDRPYSEIAEILGISESNVGTKIARIKERLRREIARAERM